MRTCPWSWQRTWQFLEGKGLRASNSPIQNCDCSSRCECSWPARFSKIRTGSHSAAENRVRASLHSSGLQTCGCVGPGWQQEFDVHRFFNRNLLWAPTGPVTSSLKSPHGARPTVDRPSAASPVLRDGGRVPPLNLGVTRLMSWCFRKHCEPRCEVGESCRGWRCGAASWHQPSRHNSVLVSKKNR